MILEVAVHGFDRRGALLVDLLGLSCLHPIAPGCDGFTVLALSLAGVALLAWFHRSSRAPLLSLFGESCRKEAK